MEVVVEVVADKAVERLLKELEHGGCVDEYMQDQLIIFSALAKGKSIIMTGPISLHTRTAIWVAEKLTGAKFEVEENVDDTLKSMVSCEGIGLEGRL
ncbi:RNA 3 -terminal phosphate cyclase [Pyrrhoderma noxium]|uniref:RNA 3-terminal phosphate cyclase n=1 Tax=Pyrrhoderma noxium TaxID=2282107 RepID=A0A286UXQ2_9AGAM|nr:RNA 3 -terminal phosphate cyclase [Pyrrhoderma noxium]